MMRIADNGVWSLYSEVRSRLQLFRIMMLIDAALSLSWNITFIRLFPFTKGIRQSSSGYCLTEPPCQTSVRIKVSLEQFFPKTDLGHDVVRRAFEKADIFWL